jgi:hypothetical protein
MDTSFSIFFGIIIGAVALDLSIVGYGLHRILKAMEKLIPLLGGK